MIDPKILRRLSKVLTLSKEGADGEASAAKHQLDVMLKKFGLTIHDLELETKAQMREFKISNDTDFPLLKQIISMVVDSFDSKYFTKGRSKKFICVELTHAQNAEVSMTYAIMLRALKKEQLLTYMAFIQANKLFPETSKENGDGLSPEKIAELRATLMRADLIEKTQVRKAIEAPAG